MDDEAFDEDGAPPGASYGLHRDAGPVAERDLVPVFEGVVDHGLEVGAVEAGAVGGADIAQLQRAAGVELQERVAVRDGVVVGERNFWRDGTGLAGAADEAGRLVEGEGEGLEVSGRIGAAGLAERGIDFEGERPAGWGRRRWSQGRLGRGRDDTFGATGSCDKVVAAGLAEGYGLVFTQRSALRAGLLGGSRGGGQWSVDRRRGFGHLCAAFGAVVGFGGLVSLGTEEGVHSGFPLVLRNARRLGGAGFEGHRVLFCNALFQADGSFFGVFDIDDAPQQLGRGLVAGVVGDLDGFAQQRGGFFGVAASLGVKAGLDGLREFGLAGVVGDDAVDAGGLALIVRPDGQDAGFGGLVFDSLRAVDERGAAGENLGRPPLRA